MVKIGYTLNGRVLRPAQVGTIKKDGSETTTKSEQKSNSDNSGDDEKKNE